MTDIIKIARCSKRFLTWHRVIEMRSEYHSSNASHAGRYYQMLFGINDDYLEKTQYEIDCINYINENYVIRDNVQDIMESHNLDWVEIEKDVYHCENFKIHCKHLDYIITEHIPLFDGVSLIQEYETSNMEDAFEFILKSIQRG